MDDVGTAAFQYLSTVPNVVAQVGSFPLNDPVVANQGLPWIFTGDLLVLLQNTSSAAVVCHDAGMAASPLPLGTALARRLQLDIYVDPARDINNNITSTKGDTRNRGNALIASLFAALHRTNPDTQVWGDLVTVNSQLLSEADWLDTPEGDGDGMQMKTLYYSVLTGGWTDSVP